MSHLVYFMNRIKKLAPGESEGYYYWQYLFWLKDNYPEDHDKLLNTLFEKKSRVDTPALQVIGSEKKCI